MKGHRQALAFATAVLALPLLAYSQNPSDQSMQGSQAPIKGQHEATLMKPARAVLVNTLDADKDHDGYAVKAKLDQKVTLTNGTELPKGTVIVGKVSTDDMQEQGQAKLALRFDQADLKNGTTVPVRATIVGFYPPNSVDETQTDPGDQVPNDWTARTLQLDQEHVISGVDLHSRISSQNSGVFVATKDKDVKLRLGSEIQFAIAPAANGQNNTSPSGL